MIRALAVAFLIVLLLSAIGGCLILDTIDQVEAEFDAEQTESAYRATAAYGAEQFHLQQTAQAGGVQ